MILRFILLLLTSIFILISCNNSKSDSISKEKVVLSKEKAIHDIMEMDTIQINQFIDDLKYDFLIKYESFPIRFFKNTDYSYHKKILLESNGINNILTINFIEYPSDKQFNNGLDLFLKNIGDLQPVIWDKDMKYLKSPPIFAVFNSRSIIILKYNCENSLEKKVIDSIQSKLLKKFLFENGTIMDVKCGGPLKWN